MPFSNSANKMDFHFAYRRYSLPFRAAVRTAQGAWPLREGIYVRIERPDGTAGWGEAAPIPAFGTETVDDAAAFCRGLGDRIDGNALVRVPGHLCALRNALAGAMDGGFAAPCHRSLGVAALLPAGRLALSQGPLKADAGFRVFKWKVGLGSADDEMAILDDLIAALPTASKIRLDANGAWNLRTAQRWLARCSERPIEFVEQPVAPDSKGAEDRLQGLCADYPVPIALDESIRNDGDVVHWLEAGWPGYFVVKPSLLADKDALLARLSASKARVVFSSALETGIGAKAALRAAFGWTGAASALGFGVWPLFSDPAFDGPAAAPFIRIEDVDRINPEVLWNALN
jgi:o-succinylbenzoate synthase